MKVLVTGGFGYIGSYVVTELLGRGHEVGVVSRGKPDHLEDICRSVAFHRWDIRDPWPEPAFPRYDLMIHAAAANDIDCADADFALDVNVRGTRNCLEFCRAADIPRLIYFSTFQVFGIGEGFVGEDDPALCRNDYGITHFFAEEYVRMFSRNGAVESVILRPTNVYGAPLHRDIDRWSLVPSCFCKEAFEQGSITLQSSGQQHRDFISVRALASRTVAIAENFKKLSGQTLTIGGGGSTTIIEVARLVQSVYERSFGKPCALQVRSDAPAESQSLIAEATKLEKAGLGVEDKSSLEAEIADIFTVLRGNE
ncbi:MAG: hypothetical protein JWO70_4511 [Betaproteobacteria bacterium]|nr:hypothetical protein [Betaproteobacteria bacterium]